MSKRLLQNPNSKVSEHKNPGWQVITAKITKKSRDGAIGGADGHRRGGWVVGSEDGRSRDERGRRYGQTNGDLQGQRAACS